jgi:hypothetical protein
LLTAPPPACCAPQIVDKINAKIAKGEVRAACGVPRCRSRALTRCAGAVQTFYSFEFFPPKTEDGLENLWERMDGMVAHQARCCCAAAA